ncbi:helix-turn-helix transcriptional regulator [Streptomyces rochei]|uniref:helix-turn-helix domain-containing protein n=1 Tax=Streptomyces rochei TaxID=1928 RepID=UPI00343B904A
MPEPFELLDAAMNERRLQLRMNWQQVAETAGISYTALRAIRRGDYRPTELTSHRLDDALQWEPGSVQAVMRGEPPRSREDRAGSPPTPATSPTPALSPDQETVRRVVRATARELGLKPDELDELMILVRKDLERMSDSGGNVDGSGGRRAG